MTDFLPRLVSWNITRRCNLSCAHCYLEADSRASSRGEMMTYEAMAFIEQLAALCPGAMLVFSGGEPLMRAGICPAWYPTPHEWASCPSWGPMA